jgi:hypothetical protein
MFNLIKSLEEAHDLMYSLQNGSVDADHYRRVVARMEFALRTPRLRSLRCWTTSRNGSSAS